MRATFAPSVDLHFFKLRMRPADCACQHVMSQQMSVDPPCHLLSASDGLGNEVQYGSYSATHDHFCVQSEGTVECSDYLLPDEAPSHIWLCASPLASWDDELRLWASRCANDDSRTCGHHDVAITGNAARQQAQQLMHAVHERLHYERFATDNGTTALDVFRSRHGVCQDFAHLMIAACRALGLRARYVNGLVAGEGETHAWVEVHDGHCWHGYDPTRDLVIQTGYIRLAQGRDVSDCPSNRGRIYRWTDELLTVHAEVCEIQNS